MRDSAGSGQAATAEEGGNIMARVPGTLVYLRPAALAVVLTVGLIVGLILGPSAANANNGSFMVMGINNTADSTTSITRTGSSGGGPAFQVSGGSQFAGIQATSSQQEAVAGHANGTAPAIHGTNSWRGPGVMGENDFGEGDGVYGYTSGGGAGVHGQSVEGPAVLGDTHYGDGVRGETTTPSGSGAGGGSGVSGLNNGDGPGVQGENLANGNGVVGLANNPFASGVYGQNDGNGYGVAGRSNTGVGLFGDSANGTAVFANSPAGTALNVQGAIITNRGGVATVPAGKNRVVQSVPNIAGTAFVLATVQGPKGKVWVISATVTPGVHGSITIFLNANAPTDTRVGWFTLN